MSPGIVCTWQADLIRRSPLMKQMKGIPLQPHPHGNKAVLWFSISIYH